VAQTCFAQVPTATTYRPYYAAMKNRAHAHIAASGWPAVPWRRVRGLLGLCLGA
jgi:hypothetical protein